jgi:hypothetical protein
MHKQKRHVLSAEHAAAAIFFFPYAQTKKTAEAVFLNKGLPCLLYA